MDYKSYISNELEKLLFVEITKDITLNVKGSPVLKTGEYPMLYDSVVNLAQRGMEGISAPDLIDGMLHIIACDPNFKYNKDYIELLKSIEGIESYIIMSIEKNKEVNLKKAVIYATALNELFPRKDFGINRVSLLMKLYEKTNQEFLVEEILRSLNLLIAEYPSYALAHYYLGEYYLDKDMDKAKYHLRKCTDDPITSNDALERLEKIKNIENYDRAVELVREGEGYEALKTLIPYIEDNPNNLDAIFYTAVAYRQTENYHKAFLYLNELVNLGGERLEVYSEMGLNLAMLGDFEGAVEYFKKALKIMPNEAGVICNIAVCYLNLGNLEEAKKAFGLASRLNPKDEIAREWLEKLGGE